MMLLESLKSRNLNHFDAFDVSVHDSNAVILYDFSAYSIGDFFRLLNLLDLSNTTTFGLHEGSSVFYLDIYLDYVEQCK